MRQYQNRVYYTDNSEIASRARRRNRAAVRQLQVRRRRRIAAAIAVILLCLALLLGKGIRAFAGSGDDSLHAYYTAVTVEAGDTIWNLADEYLDGTDVNKEDYVKQICKLNNIPNGEIHTGETIVMMYYSTEIK